MIANTAVVAIIYWSVQSLLRGVSASHTQTDILLYKKVIKQILLLGRPDYGVTSKYAYLSSHPQPKPKGSWFRGIWIAWPYAPRFWLCKCPVLSIEVLRAFEWGLCASITWSVICVQDKPDEIRSSFGRRTSAYHSILSIHQSCKIF